MSRRTRLNKHAVLTDADSITAPESEYTDVSGIDFIQYEISLDATVDADLSVLYCNDDRISDTSEFKPLDFTQATPLDGSSNTDGLVQIENKGFKFLKLSISNNGGTGNINASVFGLTRGA